jgi:hypothetical protein
LKIFSHRFAKQLDRLGGQVRS